MENTENQRLLDILSSILSLTQSNDDSETSIREDFNIIFNNSPFSNTEPIDNINKLDSYIEEYMVTLFITYNTNNNFIFSNTDKWIDLLHLHLTTTTNDYIIALQIILYLTNVSFINRQALAYQQSIKTALFKLLALTSEFREQNIKHSRTIQFQLTELYARILSINCRPREIVDIYDKILPFNQHQLISTLGNHISDPLLQNYLQFENSSLSLNAIDTQHDNTITLQLYIEFNNVTSNRFLSLGDKMFFEINQGRFTVSNFDGVIESICDYEFEIEKEYLLIIEISNEKVIFYTEGYYINSIVLLGETPLKNCLMELTIGSMISSFKLFKLYAWNVELPIEVIKMIYLLGPLYQNSFMIPYDYNGISSSVDSSLFREVYQNSEVATYSSYDGFLDILKIWDTKSLLIDLDIENLIGKYHTDGFICQFNDDSSTVLGKCYYFHNSNIASIFHSVNFIELTIHAIESSENWDDIYNRTEELIILLREPTLLNWFVTEHGFSILSHTLKLCVKKFQQGLSIQFMDLFLNNFCTNYESLQDLLIKNEFAYETLILNFELWYFKSDDETIKNTELELLRFVFFHINLLITSSKYSVHNMNILLKYKIVSRLLSFVHNNSTLELSLLHSDINSMISPLLYYGISHSTLKMVLNFSFLELENRNPSNSILCLDFIDSVLEYSLADSNAGYLALVHQLVHPRTLLLLMSELVKLGLSPLRPLQILARLFSSNRALFVSFIKSNGIFLLLRIFTISPEQEYLGIVHSLFLSSLGMNNNPSTDEILHDYFLLPKNINIISPEFLLLSLTFLDWVVFNNTKLKNFTELDNFTEKYCSQLIDNNLCSIQHPFNNNVVHPQVIKMLTLLLQLHISFECSKNKDYCFRSVLVTRNIIALSIYDTIHVAPNSEFEDLLTKVMFPLKSTLLDEEELAHDSYLDLSFFYSILPAIFDKLLESNIIKTGKLLVHSNVVTLLSIFLNYFMTIKVKVSFLLDFFDILVQCVQHKPKISIFHFHNTKDESDIDHLFSKFSYLIVYLQLTKQLKWNEKEVNRFCDILERNCSIIFSKKRNIGNHTLTAMYYIFLQCQLNEHPSMPVVCHTLRSILKFKESDVSHIISVLDPLHKNEIRNSFNVFLESRGDEGLAHILSLDEFLLNDSKITQFSNICKSEASILSKRLSYDGDKLSNKVYCNKVKDQKSLQKNVTTLYDDFNEKNKALTKRFIFSGNKAMIDLLSDTDEASNYYTNILYRIKINFLHVHKVRNSSDPQILWRLDGVENINRARRKLLPAHAYNNNETLLISSAITGRDHIGDFDEENLTNETIGKDIVDDTYESGLDNLNLRNENKKILKILKDSDVIKAIWNTSLVVGLDLREGILILGNKYLYFVSNYFFSKTEGNIMKIGDVPKTYRDVDIGLIINHFESPQVESNKPIEVNSWRLERLAFVTKRPFLLRDVALEILFDNNTTLFFSFKDSSIREKVYHPLSKVCKPYFLDPLYADVLEELNDRSNMIGTQNGISKTSLTTKFVNVITPTIKNKNMFEVTDLWRRGKISNFYYLMVINTLAGRSFNDLTQYPVFPWVISDYTSETLDLTNEDTFRDLSKPMGAQGDKRRTGFVERYNALRAVDDPLAPPFHYGTHYSSAMIVSSYLIRLKPFTESFILLQDGTFGHPDRLFNSIERTWRSAALENTTDVRELIPEFFFLPEFLLNINDYDFGTNQKGEKVGNVILPPWANGDPKIFIAKNRCALESPYVSKHLHEWIDLVFGYKQKGKLAEENVNVFNKMSYPGAINLEKIDDENERRAVAGMIHNFGQTPLQIFQDAHPEMLTLQSNTFDFSYLQELTAIPSIENNVELLDPTAYLVYLNDMKFHVNSFTKFFVSGKYPAYFVERIGSESVLIDGIKYRNIHLSELTVCIPWKDGMFITGDVNGLIKVWTIDGKGISDLKLTHKTTLHGHLHSILSIEIYSEYYTIVTLDSHGNVYTWDMISYELIRCVHRDTKLMAVSSLHGTMLILSNDNKLLMYNVNTLNYTNITVPEESKITSFRFLEFKTHDPYAGHMYLDQLEVICVGYNDGTIRIFQLIINRRNVWELILLRILTVNKKVPITTIKAVTDVTYRKPKDDTLGLFAPTLTGLKLACGTANGELLIWK
ncbi:similar to Saccharomyces cerevisiae YCR032W BPH1 PProtein homologous to human Chediak-Higashi syndrome and murine Beige proteins [Maudiozyma saulgeensis]|uniref:Beige protein homolog 1 n=1 Tax=Maudiozyma saulgeensis TaxID=1789683 RepID=A0A1X7R3A1_9SACH|nr:similar to Saccharomyces cerevisiae YCR032W BPH1 PProtein homologous to human Chediak-Higashi syndrome and murine Beige proteins [Kazachstania saulgeensis]